MIRPLFSPATVTRRMVGFRETPLDALEAAADVRHEDSSSSSRGCSSAWVFFVPRGFAWFGCPFPASGRGGDSAPETRGGVGIPGESDGTTMLWKSSFSEDISGLLLPWGWSSRLGTIEAWAGAATSACFGSTAAGGASSARNREIRSFTEIFGGVIFLLHRDCFLSRL